MRAINPKELLDLLLQVYWEGGIEQKHAAQLVGIRKVDFACLAWFWLLDPIMEKAAWSYYLERFNCAFPECDRRTVMQAPQASAVWAKSRYRSHTATEARTYTEAEMLTPPNPELETGLTA